MAYGSSLANKMRDSSARGPTTHSVLSPLVSWLPYMDACVAIVLVPVAAFVVVNGLDDLFLDLICLIDWLRRRFSPVCQRPPSDAQLRKMREKRIAVFIPCWQEHAVIANMIGHNISAIRYRNYDFFIGAYPNDEPTLQAVRELESRFANVQLAVCAHDGPTSKADCLNWVYQRMLLFEEDRGVRFDIVVTHDAEDLIHPDAFPQMNYYCDRYGMVQIPVLALPTPFRKIAHGVYCDEFTEFQMRDMRARAIMRSFIPSSGVGTAYSRAALEKLATAQTNRVFEPACLTEDYENGLRLHRLGCAQIFLPPHRTENGVVATREYFPMSTATAIRQRTRWVMGIALQTWERYGWSGSATEIYWFWRDRKGLLGSPASLLSNLLFCYGFATWIAAQLTHTHWGLARQSIPYPLIVATLGLQALHAGLRAFWVARFYSWTFAAGVPVRIVWANLINGVAGVRAVYRYTLARLRHQPLVWVKTAHAYPSRAALAAHKRKLGEILVGSSYITQDELDEALRTQPTGVRLGQYLVARGQLSEEDLYDALSLQQSVPAGVVESAHVTNKVARALPRKVVWKWKILPYRIAEGNMYLASPEIPTDELSDALRGFTRMTLRFQLVTPANFAELTRALL